MRLVSLALLALVTLTLAAAEATAARRLRIATDGHYPPFSRIEADGRPSGYDVDVAGAVCAKLAAECEIVAPGWDELIPSLLAKKVDLVVASLPISDEARRRVEFTAKYHQIAPRFVARADAPPLDPRSETAAGKRVGARAGTAHAAYLEATWVPKGAKLLTFPTEADALTALAGGRLDLVLGDALALYDRLDRDPASGLRFVGRAVEAPRFFGAGAGIAFRREDRDLGAQVDKALLDLDRDGTLDRLVGRHFPFAIR